MPPNPLIDRVAGGSLLIVTRDTPAAAGLAGWPYDAVRVEG